MLTEEEAKTKWCPHVRITAGDDPSGSGAQWHTNRPSVADVDQKGFDLCSASDCMAWRWGGHQTEERRIDSNAYDERDAARAEGWRYVCSYDDGRCLFRRALSEKPKVGYCGAFGKPEGV